MFLEQKNKSKLYMLVKSTRERSLTFAKAHSILTRKKTWILLEVRFKYPTTVSIFIVRESKITEYTLRYDYLRNLLKRYLNFHCENIIELHIDNTRNGNKNFWENSRQFFCRVAMKYFVFVLKSVSNTTRLSTY